MMNNDSIKKETNHLEDGEHPDGCKKNEYKFFLHLKGIKVKHYKSSFFLTYIFFFIDRVLSKHLVIHYCP